jgi:hypothetical protein
MKRGLLVSVVIAVALSSGALLAVGAPAGAQSTTTAGGEPIKVAYIYPDLAKLKGTGFVVDVGDPEAQANAFVGALNSRRHQRAQGRPEDLQLRRSRPTSSPCNTPFGRPPGRWAVVVFRR